MLREGLHQETSLLLDGIQRLCAWLDFSSSSLRSSEMSSSDAAHLQLLLSGGALRCGLLSTIPSLLHLLRQHSPQRRRVLLQFSLQQLREQPLCCNSHGSSLLSGGVHCCSLPLSSPSRATGFVLSASSRSLAKELSLFEALSKGPTCSSQFEINMGPWPLHQWTI